MKKNLLHRSLSVGVTSGSSSSGDSSSERYTVNLNGQWEQTTAVSNPDSSVYDGVYRSVSNYNVNNGVATMYITIKDCSSFKMYIRSYAESNYDYVMVSLLDTIITGSSSYSDTTLVKAHTRGNQQSGTAISSYTPVLFTGISSGEHTITVVYRKDSSVNSGDDRGYVLIDLSLKLEEDEVSETNVYIIDKDEILWEVDDWTGGNSAIGVALIITDAITPLYLWIEKNESNNTSYYLAANSYDSIYNNSDYFTWGGFLDDPRLTNYSIAGPGCSDYVGYLPYDNGNYNLNSNLITSDYTRWTSGAVSDLKGKTNSKIISTILDNGTGENTYTPMGVLLNIFNTPNNSDNLGHTDWYIPSLGLLALILLYTSEINAALSKIGGKSISGSYWSSTEKKPLNVGSSNGGFQINTSTRRIYAYGKVSGFRVRLVRNLNMS